MVLRECPCPRCEAMRARIVIEQAEDKHFRDSALEDAEAEYYSGHSKTCGWPRWCDNTCERRLPVDSAARKAMPMFSGLIAYFPLALAAVAKHSKDNNDKHNPGEPLHWSREKSSDHLDCIIRHLADRALAQARGDRAEVLYHQCAIAWRALAQLELDEENPSV